MDVSRRAFPLFEDGALDDLPLNQPVAVNNQVGPMKFAVQGFPTELCLPTGKKKLPVVTSPDGGSLQ